MHFKLTPAFTETDSQKDVDKVLEIVFAETRNILMQIGLEFVRDARLKTKSQAGLDDQTGNLRSSIGFILVYNGQMETEDFKPHPLVAIKKLAAAKGLNAVLTREAVGKFLKLNKVVMNRYFL